MKTYIGTKQVKAEPMNELAAVENGYARKNEDNHEWREGYHVQYTNPDGRPTTLGRLSRCSRIPTTCVVRDKSQWCVSL